MLDVLRFTDGLTLIATGELPEVTHDGKAVVFVPARVEATPWCWSMSIMDIAHPRPNAWQATIECDPAATEAQLVVDGKPARVRWPEPAPAPKPVRRSRRKGTMR
jgi:hypothetical protein